MFLRLQIVLFVFLIINSTCFSLNPEKDYKYSHKDFNLLAPVKIKLKTVDGFEINTWHFKTSTDKKKTTIVIAGGDAGNMSYSLFYVKRLVDLGFDVVTFDYRGFGKSSDFKINKDYLFYSEFSIDLETVIEYLQNTISINTIGLMSFSMGTIITAISYNKIQYALSFIISENFVINPYKIKDNLYIEKKRKVFIPKNITRREFEECLKSINTPMLMFFGNNDLITTVKEGEEIKSVLNKKGVYVDLITHNGGHGDGVLFLKENDTEDSYFRYINNFIKKWNNE